MTIQTSVTVGILGKLDDPAKRAALATLMLIIPTGYYTLGPDGAAGLGD